MEHARAILINTHLLSETSLIAVWCTDSHGIVRSAARGARRPKSPFAGKLDLFHSGEITWKPGKSELHPLIEVSIDNYHPALRRAYLPTLMASYFCRLIEHCLEPEHPIGEVHDLLTRALGYLEKKSPDARAMRHFEKEFACIEGCYRPGISAATQLENHFGSLPRLRQQVLDRLN